MSSLKKFAVATPRPLPVIVLADTSGSMGENDKIEALNAAMKDMISTFTKEGRLRAEIQVGLITFGGKAQMHLPLVAAHSVAEFAELKAEGVTPMGAAFDLALQLLAFAFQLLRLAFGFQRQLIGQSAIGVHPAVGQQGRGRQGRWREYWA